MHLIFTDDEMREGEDFYIRVLEGDREEVTFAPELIEDTESRKPTES